MWIIINQVIRMYYVERGKQDAARGRLPRLREPFTQTDGRKEWKERGKAEAHHRRASSQAGWPPPAADPGRCTSGAWTWAPHCPLPGRTCRSRAGPGWASRRRARSSSAGPWRPWGAGMRRVSGRALWPRSGKGERDMGTGAGAYFSRSSVHCRWGAKQAMAHTLISIPVWNCLFLMSHTPWMGVAMALFCGGGGQS